jgi:hypothetical protein
MNDPRPAWDPLQSGVELPFRRVYYPLGFPLHLAANSSQVLEAANHSFPWTQAAFETPALQLQVLVSGEPTSTDAPAPQARARGPLLTLAADARHFASCDLERGFAACWVSARQVARQAHFRHLYLEALVYCMLSSLYVTPVHGSCVASLGRGVLLTGKPGAGKSCLAYACARGGLSFVSDDVGYLLRSGEDRRLLGRPARLRFRTAAGELFPELAAIPASLDVTGEEVLEISTAHLDGIVTAPDCVAEHVVFLERRPQKAARVEPISQAEALDRLSAELPLFSEAVRYEHIASLERLTRRGAQRLIYSALDPAVDCIRRLIEEN